MDSTLIILLNLIIILIMIRVSMRVYKKSFPKWAKISYRGKHWGEKILIFFFQLIVFILTLFWEMISFAFSFAIRLVFKGKKIKI